ncbi:MAG: glycosyltransferase family protein [Nanoarchaeota archaeon]
MKKIGIIIQARMTSTRLPGKVLMDVGGMPLLAFLIKRLKSSVKNIDVIVATTKDKDDDKIVELCNSINVPYYRGSKENVLDRYIKCSREFNIDVIIRVCADSPFIDTEGINELVIAYHQNPLANLIHNKHKNGYPPGAGAELVTLESLEKAEMDASEQNQREHVLPYILEHSEKFNIIECDAPKHLRRPDYHIAVDYPEDLKLVNLILTKADALFPNQHEKVTIPLKNIIRILDDIANNTL